MNTPSPFIPQGSFLEREQQRGHSKVKLAVFAVLGFHVVLLAMMLIQGCRHNQEADATAQFASLNSAASSPNRPTDTVALAEPTITNAPTLGLPDPIQTSTMPILPGASARVQGTATKDYRVVTGDTLAKIAKRHAVSLNVLTQANPGVDPARLQVGQFLQVPEKSRLASTQTGRQAGGFDPAGGFRQRIDMGRNGGGVVSDDR
jgi:hypothetical protein